MSNLLNTLPQAVVAKIEILLPDLKECKAISGRFNVDRLKEEAVRTPAVLIAPLRLRLSGQAGGPVPHFELEMAAYVFSRDVMGMPRDTAAALMAGIIASYVPNKRWGEPCAGQAEKVVAQSLIDSTNRSFKASLWAVSWIQPVVLFEAPIEAPVDLSVFASQAPLIGEAHRGDYEEIGGDA